MNEWDNINPRCLVILEIRRPDPDRERMDSRTSKVNDCIDKMELQMMGISHE